jgi:superfamily II DNA helicase RecQ
VAALQALGIPALALTSLTPKDQVTQMYRLMGEERAKGGPALVYVTPERVVSAKRFMAKLEKVCKVGPRGGGGT